MTVVHALHGFLGSPKDWDFLQPRRNETHTLQAWDLFDENVGKPFTEWAKDFNRRVREQGNPGPRILLGYSLGGRLALHALLDDPKLWSMALIVSANPGLASDEERNARLKSDENWADRFRTENWSSLMHDWNTQAVFAGRDPGLPKSEHAFDRERLARSLTGWSLGRQENLLPAIRNLSVPTVWMAGEDDSKFKNLAQAMSESQPKKCSRLLLIPGAAHRVPWENPTLFREIFSRALSETKHIAAPSLAKRIFAVLSKAFC